MNVFGLKNTSNKARSLSGKIILLDDYCFIIHCDAKAGIYTLEGPDILPRSIPITHEGDAAFDSNDVNYFLEYGNVDYRLNIPGGVYNMPLEAILYEDDDNTFTVGKLTTA